MSTQVTDCGAAIRTRVYLILKLQLLIALVSLTATELFTTESPNTDFQKVSLLE